MCQNIKGGLNHFSVWLDARHLELQLLFLLAVWSLRGIHPQNLSRQTQRDLGEQCVTTSDPATLIALRLTVFKSLQYRARTELETRNACEISTRKCHEWIQSCIIRLASFKAQFNMGSVASSSPPSSALQSWPPHWHLYCT